MSQDWTEKYRPTCLSQIIGNPKAVSELKTWAEAWNKGRPEKRAVILIGSPGIGKTSAAGALAVDMGWDIVEMNASDQRTGDAIRDIAIRGANFNTFTDDGYKSVADGGRKLIILDEADSLFGREDRGALPAIVELIRGAKQPVILIVNDFYALSRKSSTIKTETMQITFMRPRITEIIKALDKIAANENVKVTPDAMKSIAENSNGDMRAAVRNLESLALGCDIITIKDAERLSERVVRKDMYDLMNAIFRKGDAMEARKIMMSVDETPEHVMTWVDENLPYEFRDSGDLVRGYEKLSRADIFLGRVMRRQYYRFWSYAGDMMTAGVNLSRRGTVSYDRFKFPSYLMKMSRSKGVRAVKNGVCLKTAILLHTSTRRVSCDILPSLKAMMKNDQELTRSLVSAMDLEPDEVAFLLETKIDSKVVKDAFIAHTAVKPKEEDIVTTKKTVLTADDPIPVSPTLQKNQKSLFQF